MLNETPLSRIDLNLLVLFEAVLAERHVARAADRLKISASAVSHGLRRLRDLLNDPLFLKHPKGVVPTARASELAEPIAQILAQVRKVVGSADPFDPATSARRFVIGGTDGISGVVLPPLLAAVNRVAPRIDIGVVHLLRTPWEAVLADLDARVADIAILPIGGVPARFAARTLYEDEFVIAMRANHPLSGTMTLKRYCEAGHVLVSPAGDAHGHFDEILNKQGLARRVAVTVTSFMMALATVAETGLIAAVPRRLATANAQRFRLAYVDLPFDLRADRIRAIVPKVALMDDGVAWLFDLLEKTAIASLR